MNLATGMMGAFTGFLTALLVDLDAWKSADENAKFSWNKAMRRWLYGTVAGFSMGIGGGAIQRSVDSIPQTEGIIRPLSYPG